MGTVVLVTGANGFVGRHLIPALLQESNLEVFATDIHDSLIAETDTMSSVMYLKGDLSDRVFVNRLHQDRPFDCVIHLAAVLSQATDMNTYFAIMNSNIQATFLLLEAAKNNKARFIFPSTALVYGNQKGPFREDMLTNPGDFYALSKLMCEQLIRFYGNKYNVPSVIFRIGILYGLSQTGQMFIPSLISALLAGRDFPMTKGEQTRDFVFIEDFILAVKTVLGHNELSGIFNIGTGNAPTLKEAAQIAERVANAYGVIKLGAVPYREKESWEYCLNSTKALRELKWQASTSLEQGLAKTIAFRQKGQSAHA
ncbi:MAG: hypothetical protein A2487_07385 [Candidatus Raymondbacteria bacterium RifOxyC12_full_50_8]|uniref:NAD-dependent epimerase/dehydratase domain-containing protein n=1 Tax=Candidatus Raymondbacteria bacterium RIFOXYD12_FULL_49_13 TaxID=1817890 RepID=A0A1F7F6M0_UNCRA|nr:MAG: hypothetical protein A2350_06870 [Candidatus Raymondbacteria bacterium RifOxyB12_full_50_8]OGJ93204.1 MAG: hypothetical protein A2248_17690 [Candidatus Raymondbacteria bacterium RIFOXYA2_FULL_49_16]OGJ99423.1 MAG: hypothetical protein A2487_07385 [Candidatus Raymondbacteria bacterium RifOxyC12_full_50_8]OGK02310.1 MAG: hypothetical protein A2519_16720 [Candidatus Raymondbacteria bacterium RIFOXYD12_FULL_49_13]OGP44926.1 MAG: hypothetical protein A2324_19615 [Candidatus Raymondbacteria b